MIKPITAEDKICQGVAFSPMILSFIKTFKIPSFSYLLSSLDIIQLPDKKASATKKPKVWIGSGIYTPKTSWIKSLIVGYIIKRIQK